jgi:hypothetical protein
MRCLLVILCLVATVLAAPIPKALKKQKSYNFDGVWEQIGSNVNGKDEKIIHGKYWKLEKDTFWYSMPSTESEGAGNKSKITTPDESKPQYKLYSNSRCLLELEDEDTLKWIFVSDKDDPLDTCEPGRQRSLYTFKRVK